MRTERNWLERLLDTIPKRLNRGADFAARVAPKGGNVSRAEVARRRAANKRARASRKRNRRR